VGYTGAKAVFLPAETPLPKDGATVRDVTVAMLSIDDTLSYLLYDQERMLQHENRGSVAGVTWVRIFLPSKFGPRGRPVRSTDVR
jgi:hypothetical protein